MTVRYGVCLFDLDGTLTDSKPGILASLGYAFALCDVPVPDAAVLNKFLGPPIRDSLRDFCGLSGEKIEAVVESYRKHYSAQGLYNNKLYHGVSDLLEKL